MFLKNLNVRGKILVMCGIVTAGLFTILISLNLTLDIIKNYLNELYSVMEQSEELTAIYGKINGYITSVTVFTIVISALVLISGAIVAARVIRMIRKGVQEAMYAAEKMADGDFMIDINYTSKDEIGRLAESMKKLANRTNMVIEDIDYMLEETADGNLCVESKNEEIYVGSFSNIIDSMKNYLNKMNGTMSKIHDAAEQVASGSEQVSNGAQSLSQGATEQASSIQELSATINVISDMITSNANDAAEASSQTNIAGSQMKEVNIKMEELVKAMNEISASSDETKKIIKTIEDIAFQTNILALNAAVEAARAGAAGKGFAVVADEVRNLAGKSADAANNTTALIESTITAIKNGNLLVEDVASKMNSVADAAGKVAIINEKISEASKEAADSITQVTVGIDQISGVVQTNSATAEESAAASEELSGQAQMMNKLVSGFNLSI